MDQINVARRMSKISTKTVASSVNEFNFRGSILSLKQIQELENCHSELNHKEPSVFPKILLHDYIFIHPQNVDEFLNTRYGVARRRLNNFFNNPQSSRGAKIFSLTSTIAVLVSVVTMVLASMQQFQDDNGDPNRAMRITEMVCIIFFTLEYIIRFLVTPRKIQFLKSPMEAVDLISVVPFYLDLILHATETSINEFAQKKLKRFIVMFRLLRVMRVARILKLARHSGNLKNLGQVFQSSKKELLMLLMYLGSFILFFSSVMYFFEKEEPKTSFTSIPATFWWCIVTMTTVGYGDMIPQTPGGKLVTSIATIMGVVVLTFPISMLVANFNKQLVLQKQEAADPPEEDKNNRGKVKVNE